jgi:phosphoglycerate kinase
MKFLNDVEVSDKKVLVRCDFNVPIDADGKITDDYRIQQTIPTIKYLIDKKAKVILMSHLDPDSTGLVDKKYSLLPVAQRLSDLLNMTVEMTDDCVGPQVEVATGKLQQGQVLLLENLRFHKEETDGDPEFAKQLSFLGEVYVNDAFSVCHRAHASVSVLPGILPSCAGLLLQKEMEALNKVMQNPVKPMVAVVGGKKVETKSKFIDKISESADVVLLGGLLKAEIDEKHIVLEHPEKIIGPVDDLKALDISDKTIDLFNQKIAPAKTALWNGNVGKFEEEQYAKGSLAIANAIIASGAYSVVGGGETVEFLEKYKLLDKFSHVSTGGGAMISYLSGDQLPGIVALN